MLNWKLGVNYQQTELVVFNENLGPLKMGNNMLQIPDFSKVLGITVDDKLTFDKQRSACIKSIEQNKHVEALFIHKPSL